MKCEYCKKEIPAGTEVIASGHFFCNSLHRYSWEQEQIRSGKDIPPKKNTSVDFNSVNNSGGSETSGTGTYGKYSAMSLGDIFNTAFNLIKKTFTRNLIIAVVFLFPAGIFMAYGTHIYFTMLLHTTKAAAENGAGSGQYNPAQFANMFINVGLYFLSFAIFALAFLGVTIGITKVACSEFDGEKISVSTAFRKIFSVTYLRAIGQILLFGVIIFADIVAVVIVMVILKLSNVDTLNIMGGLLILVSILTAVYLIFKWYFAFIAMVHTGSGVIKSFSQSSSLVKGHWWRTFGIVLLISIMVNFAIYLVITPISFVFMWGYYSEYFKLLTSGAMEQSGMLEILKLMSSYGFELGALYIVILILQTLLLPVFNVVIYFDLKIRKNQFK